MGLRDGRERGFAAGHEPVAFRTGAVELAQPVPALRAEILSRWAAGGLAHKVTSYKLHRMRASITAPVAG